MQTPKSTTRANSGERKLPGKEYEALVARIYSEFSDNATVALDEKIIGASGELRQIDVAIRNHLLGSPVLVIVECKDYRRRVAVGTVDSLIGKIEDIQAHKGILVSKVGFTRGARATSE